MPAPTKHKSAPARMALTLRQFKSLDGAAGTFSGYLGVFDNKDRNGDVIQPGAFTKTLADASAEQSASDSPFVLPILWQHNPSEPIGGFTLMREDAYGLYVEGQLDLDIEQGQRAYSALNKGYVRSLSIGYDTIREIWQKGARYLTEIRLWEGSIVTFPANQLAIVGDTKGLYMNAKQRRAAKRAAERANATEAKARDFTTVYAQEAEADDLLEDFDDLCEALGMTLVETLMDQTGAEPDTAGVATSLAQFNEAVQAWVARAAQADTWADMADAAERMANIETEYLLDGPYCGYMSVRDLVAARHTAATAPTSTKAGRALSAPNADRLTKALDMAGEGHGMMAKALDDMRAFVSDNAPAQDEAGADKPEDNTDNAAGAKSARVPGSTAVPAPQHRATQAKATGTPLDKGVLADLTARASRLYAAQ